MITLHIDGRRVEDIASFYEEVNRVFMQGEDWRLGESLDALDDLLYGGYGALHRHESARVVWEEHELSAAALGLRATREQLLTKLAAPQRYDQDLLRRRLEQLDAEGGPTYFETVLEIFGSHPGIELVLA
ncbi:MAG: barstar family protein [Brachybacterium sp.]